MLAFMSEKFFGKVALVTSGGFSGTGERLGGILDLDIKRLVTLGQNA